MRFVPASLVIVSTLAAAPYARAEKFISCPDQIISGCQVFTDPLGNAISPVSCPISHCKVFKPKMIDGKKVCPFNCPEFFRDQ